MLVGITGASGFIGSYTVRALKGRGHRVRALVRRTSRRDHIAGVVDEWVVGEMDDPQAMAGLAAGTQCIIHAATDFTAAESMPSVSFHRNVLGTLQLLEASRKAGVEQFIFVSSGAAYAEILQDRKLDENHPTWPDSLYGAYKASVEPFLKAYRRQFHMNTSSWRPVAVYGVNPEIAHSRWLNLVQAVQHGETVSERGGGKIVHVQDVADALAYAVGDDQVAGELFNLVDRHMYWQVSAEIARELTGSPSVIEDRKGTGPTNTYDCAKAMSFFDRHGKSKALRRGLDGVREYVIELLNSAR